MKALLRILFVLVLSLVFVVPAFAIAILDFTDGDARGGTITVAGGNVIGLNIALDSLHVMGTATKDGFYDLSGALAAAADSDDGTAAALSFNKLTKVITIVGGVRTMGAGGTQVIPNGSLLLTGTIDKLTIDAQNNFLFAMHAVGTDIKDPNLLKYLGIDPTSFTFLGFEIGANSNGSGSPYVADSTDVNNQGKVPEPISLILLGSGLAGAGLYRRLRKPRG